jgi:hypothetical protein
VPWKVCAVAACRSGLTEAISLLLEVPVCDIGQTYEFDFRFGQTMSLLGHKSRNAGRVTIQVDPVNWGSST